jgi:O-antigen ligase
VTFARRRCSRLPGWFAALVAVLPIFFVLIYVAVIDSPIVQSLFAFMDSKGKELNTRLVVWLPALEKVLLSPVFGSYSQISQFSQEAEHIQMHNSHLDVLASYGFPVLVLVCFLLYRLLRGEHTQPSRHETALRLCFSGTLLVGIGEAALFSGGLGIYIFAGIFLLLCNRESEAA